MKQHLYVGNLSPELTEEQLRALFAADGRQVEGVTIRTNARTGHSRGFGFVEMASEEDARGALEVLHGVEVAGREIKVREAHRQSRERPPAAPFDMGREHSSSRGGGGRKRGR